MKTKLKIYIPAPGICFPNVIMQQPCKLDVYFSLGVRVLVCHHHQHLLIGWRSGSAIHEEEILCEDSDFHGVFGGRESRRQWTAGPDSRGWSNLVIQLEETKALSPS